MDHEAHEAEEREADKRADEGLVQPHLYERAHLAGRHHLRGRHKTTKQNKKVIRVGWGGG